MRNDQQPKVPSFVRTAPASAAIISKMITDPSLAKDRNKKFMSPGSNVQAIALDTQQRIQNNESIQQLFPDVELSMQILCSCIISPNDITSTNLLYKAPDVKIPSDVKATIVTAISSHITTNYDFENKLMTILTEALFTEGAYIEAIIPEASLDDIINPSSGQISIESADTAIKYFDTSLKAKANIYLSNTDSIEKVNLSVEADKTTRQVELELSLSDIFLSFEEQPGVLSLPEFIINSVSKIHNHVSTESEKELELNLDNLFKNSASTQFEEVVQINTSDNASRRSVGKPLVFKLPTESVIPVHVSNNPSKHIGYFVLLDSKGTPINSADELNKMPSDLNTMANSSDLKSNIINKAKSALSGITKTEPKLENIEEMYSSIVESFIRKKLENGAYSDLVEVKDNYDVYRVMLYRALRAKRTRLLFLPAELVAYYAFEYRTNGTGKSLLEKTAMLSSIRSILLFTKLMANIKNSTTTTKISATLDEADPDPQGTMEQIISESLRTRATQLPIGVSKIEDLTEWTHKAGFMYNFKNTGLPDMDIDVTDQGTNKIIPDSEFDSDIENLIIMSFGLTPEIVKSGYDSEFATSVVAKNLLLAKRVTQYQNKLTPMLTGHICKLIRNDELLKNTLRSIVTANLASIKKLLKKDKNDENDVELAKFKDDDVVEYIIKTFINDLIVTLPKPELEQINITKDMFENHKNMVNDYVDLIFSSDTLPSSMIGNLADKLDDVKAMVKNVMYRKWMSDNNFFKEIAEFTTLSDDNKPVFAMGDDFKAFVSNLLVAITPILKETEKFVDNINTTLEKTGAMDNDSSLETNNTDDNSSNDNVPGDGAGDTELNVDDTTPGETDEPEIKDDDIKDPDEPKDDNPDELDEDLKL